MKFSIDQTQLEKQLSGAINYAMEERFPAARTITRPLNVMLTPNLLAQQLLDCADLSPEKKREHERYIRNMPYNLRKEGDKIFIDVYQYKKYDKASETFELPGVEANALKDNVLLTILLKDIKGLNTCLNNNRNTEDMFSWHIKEMLLIVAGVPENDIKNFVATSVKHENGNWEFASLNKEKIIISNPDVIQLLNENPDFFEIGGNASLPHSGKIYDFEIYKIELYEYDDDNETYDRFSSNNNNHASIYDIYNKRYDISLPTLEEYNKMKQMPQIESFAFPWDESYTEQTIKDIREGADRAPSVDHRAKVLFGYLDTDEKITRFVELAKEKAKASKSKAINIQRILSEMAREPVSHVEPVYKRVISIMAKQAADLVSDDDQKEEIQKLYVNSIFLHPKCISKLRKEFDNLSSEQKNSLEGEAFNNSLHKLEDDFKTLQDLENDLKGGKGPHTTEFTKRKVAIAIATFICAVTAAGACYLGLLEAGIALGSPIIGSASIAQGSAFFAQGIEGVAALHNQILETNAAWLVASAVVAAVILVAIGLVSYHQFIKSKESVRSKDEIIDELMAILAPNNLAEHEQFYNRSNTLLQEIASTVTAQQLNV